MRMEKFNNALDYVDSDLLDEFVREREAIEQRKLRKRRFARYSALAASFVVVFACTVALIMSNASNDQIKNELHNSNNAAIENMQGIIDNLKSELDSIEGSLGNSSNGLADASEELLKALWEASIKLENWNIASKSELKDDGFFIFEHQGKLYQAYVTPVTDETMDMIENGSVSIRSVGDLISTVKVVDMSGNVGFMEIYTSKSDSSDDGILLKLDSGYFRVNGIN